MKPLTLPLLIMIALLAAAALWGPGMVNTRGGGDSPFLLQRTVDMAEALQHGHFPPRWMAHAAYDLGYPFFNHYAALPYYLSGGLTALGVSPLLAIQITQTLGFILAALTMGLWARRLYKSDLAVLLAVAAYTFAPFHLVNVYVRGDSLSEFYAFVFYPLILWTLDRLIERPTPFRTAEAALAYAALILTHNVSALIFSPFAALYVLFRVLKRRPWGEQQPLVWGLRLAAPFLLGIALTAWFWIPALFEARYGQLGEDFTAGYFHYSNHFRGWDLVQPSFCFDYSVAGEVKSAGPFTMGLIQAIFAVLGCAVLLWMQAHPRPSGEAPRTTTSYTLTGLLLATFMITPLSSLLWEHVPLLGTTQFPWRFLSIQALFTATATGAIGVWLARYIGANRGRTVANTPAAALCLLGCGLLAVSALGSLHPDRLHITEQDVTPESLLLYEAFTGNIGTTIRYEYLPQDVVPRLYISEAVIDGKGLPIADAEGITLTAQLAERLPDRQVWQVHLESGAAPVAFPLNWWPGWEAEVDGTAVETRPMVGSGRLTVDLPAGEHTVVLHLQNTPLRTAAEAVSLLTLIAGIVLLAVQTRTGGRAPEIRHAAARMSKALALAVLSALVPCLLLGRSVDTGTRMRAFDFAQMPFPHAGPLDFTAAQLEDAVVPATAVPGEPLTLSMQWVRAANLPLTATLRLVSPAVPRHGVTYTLSEVELSLAAAESTLTAALPMPDDLARGLYLIELHLNGPEGELFAHTGQGHTMEPLYIGAVRVSQGPGMDPDAVPLARLADGALYLHAVETMQRDPTDLQVKLAWSTPGTPRNWSLSLRLLDAAGQQIASRDLQPGYGYLPTTLWMPGEKVPDYVTLSLPEGLAPGAYTLKVITYLEATMGQEGEISLPITLTQVTLRDSDTNCELERKTAPRPCEAAGVRLVDAALPETIREGEGLDFTAEWWAAAQPTADLTARWEVLGPDDTTLASIDGPLAPGSRTTVWPQHAWVRTSTHLDLPPVLPGGPYTLRLTLQDGTETRASCEIGKPIPVTLRERSFNVPATVHPQQASFEEILALRGYEWEASQETLSLTLWWQAGEQSPSQDYKRFVHLVETETAVVAVQDDAMPRGWTYPTSWWAPGEVVSETITLDLRGLPTGTYRPAVGWYVGETGTRLTAVDGSGTSAPDNRVFLQELALERE